MDGPRPCPWYGCRHHLGLDVFAGGSIAWRDLDVMPADTCALDVADRGGATLEEVGAVLGVTREAVRMSEARAMEEIVASGLGAPEGEAVDPFEDCEGLEP